MKYLFFPILFILFSSALIHAGVDPIIKVVSTGDDKGDDKGNDKVNDKGDKNGDDKRKKDPKYVEGISYKFSAYAIYLNQSTIFSFTDKNGVGEKLIYRPNMIGGITVGTHYKFFNFAYTFRIPGTAFRDSIYGETEFMNINMNFQGRSLGFGFFFQNFQGFYRDKSNSFYPRFDSKDALPQRPDLRTWTFGMDNNFVFSRKFSLKAAFQQTEIQKKSSGAFMFMLAYRLTKVMANGTVIPTELGTEYPDVYGFDYGMFNTVVMAPGYGFTAVAGPVSITPVVFAGKGLQFQTYRRQDYETGKHPRYSSFKAPWYLNFKCALGFNSTNFFCRFVYGVEMNTLPFKSTAEGHLNYLKGEACIGFRF